MGSGTTRVGGLFGVLSAAAIIPAYLAGSPEAPKNTADARDYFDSAASFLAANGTVPLLHLLFGLLFLGVPPLLHTWAGYRAPTRRSCGWV